MTAVPKAAMSGEMTRFARSCRGTPRSLAPRRYISSLAHPVELEVAQRGNRWSIPAIAVHRRPDQIVVEIARELKLSEKEKDKHKRQAARQ